MNPSLPRNGAEILNERIKEGRRAQERIDARLADETLARDGLNAQQQQARDAAIQAAEQKLERVKAGVREELEAIVEKTTAQHVLILQLREILETLDAQVNPTTRELLALRNQTERAFAELETLRGLPHGALFERFWAEVGGHDPRLNPKPGDFFGNSGIEKLQRLRNSATYDPRRGR